MFLISFLHELPIFNFFNSDLLHLGFNFPKAKYDCEYTNNIAHLLLYEIRNPKYNKQHQQKHIKLNIQVALVEL